MESRKAYILSWFVLLGLCVFTVTYGECGVKQKEVNVVARWGDKVITAQDLDTRINSFPPELKAKLQIPEQRQQFLENLVQIQIVGAEAKAQKLQEKKSVAIRIDDVTNSILLQEYIAEKMAAVKEPTDKEAEAYYEAHKGEYIAPVMVKAQHILIQTKPDDKPEGMTTAQAKADAVYKELLAGGDFAKLAEKYSDDGETKSKGGDLGLFTSDQMVPEFSQPVFAMKKGELGKPFKTPFGFHIVKVNDYIPSTQMSFKDVAATIRSRLQNEEREAAISKELERLKKKYKVWITATPKEKK